MSTTQQTIAQDATSFQCGEFAPGNTTAAPLASSVKCKRVKLIAPISDAGAAVNTSLVRFGNTDRQDDWIAKDGSRDQFVHVDDPAKIIVKLVTSTDKLKYRIEY